MVYCFTSNRCGGRAVTPQKKKVYEKKRAFNDAEVERIAVTAMSGLMGAPLASLSSLSSLSHSSLSLPSL